MKAAIVIDKWKLPIFTRHLHDAGFAYEQVGGSSELVLKVETTEGQRLAQVVLAANVECAKKGKP